MRLTTTANPSTVSRYSTTRKSAIKARYVNWTSLYQTAQLFNRSLFQTFVKPENLTEYRSWVRREKRVSVRFSPRSSNCAFFSFVAIGPSHQFDSAHGRHLSSNERTRFSSVSQRIFSRSFGNSLHRSADQSDSERSGAELRLWRWPSVRTDQHVHVDHHLDEPHPLPAEREQRLQRTFSISPSEQNRRTRSFCPRKSFSLLFETRSFRFATW